MADPSSTTTSLAGSPTAEATAAAAAAGIDPGVFTAYIAIGVMAVVPIYLGSFASLKFGKDKSKRKGKKKDEEEEEEEEDEAEYFSFDDAKWYPVIGSVTLFSLYLVLKFVSKDVINMILTANFVLIGVGAVFKALLGAARWSTGLKLLGDYAFSFTRKKKEIFGIRFGIIHLVLTAVALAVGGFYAYTKHWILSNIIGEALSIGAIQLLNLDSFATGMMLLAGLFFYDVFWVFGTEVMVTVAKGLDVPIKVVFPRNVTAVLEHGILNKPSGVGFSMLGLGDIVIPGIFVALCLNFDHYLYLQSAKGRKNKQSRWFPIPYFTTCFIMYTLGLVTTVYVMHTFKAAQPALLYLSPACIISALGVALVRGELKALFEYAPSGSPADAKKKEAASAASESSSSSPQPKKVKLLTEEEQVPSSPAANNNNRSSPVVTRQRSSNRNKK